MKVTVRIDSQLFEVEIDNLYTRPVVAVVDGQRFEVWPEVNPIPPHTEPAAASTPQPAQAAPARAAASAPVGADSSTVFAPLPGVIISVAVKPGDTVESGQELCVLEAMKMKNMIRAPRAGTIDTIQIEVNQHVKHHDVLMRYSD
ncbi:MAG: acetyl-CoA carboxylase biotin carboxyl carrier protein subunit [Chloroflexi bacterium]|nr:acetyl-CoA carboxylase biotin carboxyl carrier protein subunit [Chloroflexota bacterium]